MRPLAQGHSAKEWQGWNPVNSEATVRSTEQPVFPASLSCGQWDSGGLCHSHRGTEGPALGHLPSWDRVCLMLGN